MIDSAVSDFVGGDAGSSRTGRHDVLDAAGLPRAGYVPTLGALPATRPAAMRELGERMEAIVRELGVQYGASQKGDSAAWSCDLLPHIFTPENWTQLVAGCRQRLRAFELFLRDVYGPREILRAGVVPVHAVLGSPYYHAASAGLRLPHDAYLHLSGLCIAGGSSGTPFVKWHQLGRAAGPAYMMQNRRALARVLPAIFEENAVASLADTPLSIGDLLRQAAPESVAEPSVVLLSPGPDSPVYSEHSFLARRIGISLVEGGDLLVLDSHLFLKTVRGLKRVDVIYNRVADAYLDPLVLRKGSTLGVPGLVHCLRSGTVTLLNAVGSQLADDRALLCYAPRIIRFYLGEDPILPTVPTYWLGDIDQREMVLENLADFTIEPVSGRSLAAGLALPVEKLSSVLRKDPASYVAQPADAGTTTLYFKDGRSAEAMQDHIIYGVRRGESYDVLPGALTRVFPSATEWKGGWLTKDSWVPAQRTNVSPAHVQRARHGESGALTRDVTSRVAETFYWMGRYLERAYHQAYLIQVIETLETEELNSAERKEYRPMWNRLLPPLETSAGESRRSITTPLDRYRLTLLAKPGSVFSTLERVMRNAESVQDALSPEAWATLSSLHHLFRRSRFKASIVPDEAVRVTLRLTAKVTQRIPQFFAIASRTMLGDDGWRFCEVGERLERAIITAHAVCSIGRELSSPEPPTEIQLSAFLRLLGTRDAYRRIFQMRAEPAPLLEVLWQHPEAPRSVARCLTYIRDCLLDSAAPGSAGPAKAVSELDAVIARLQGIDWNNYVPPAPAEGEPRASTATTTQDQPPMTRLLDALLAETLDVHRLISDNFLSHQAYITQTVQPLLQGWSNGI